MPQLLRALVFRRLVAALVLAAFVPVACAAAACAAGCPLLRAPAGVQTSSASSAISASTGHGHATRVVPSDLAAPHVTQNDLHLSHAGACHLATLPALVHEPAHRPKALLPTSWARGEASPYTSFAAPPPEHRPRA